MFPSIPVESNLFDSLETALLVRCWNLQQKKGRKMLIRFFYRQTLKKARDTLYIYKYKDARKVCCNQICIWCRNNSSLDIHTYIHTHSANPTCWRARQGKIHPQQNDSMLFCRSKLKKTHNNRRENEMQGTCHMLMSLISQYFTREESYTPSVGYKTLMFNIVCLDTKRNGQVMFVCFYRSILWGLTKCAMSLLTS